MPETPTLTQRTLLERCGIATAGLSSSALRARAKLLVEAVARYQAESTRPTSTVMWDAHTRAEFSERSPERTMATMGPHPYVIHLPTLEGAAGRARVRHFYATRFIPCIPAHTTIRLLSRTVGPHRVVDEMIFEFTHDREVDFFLPGVKPSGRRVSVPLVAVVGMEAGRVHHEHIYWDQASVLAQVGAIDPARLPITGARQSRRLRVLANRFPLPRSSRRAGKRRRELRTASRHRSRRAR